MLLRRLLQVLTILNLILILFELHRDLNKIFIICKTTKLFNNIIYIIILFNTSKWMALKSWAMFVHRVYSIKFIGKCGEIWQFLHKKVGSGRIGSTLEIDSGHKNKKIGFYPKSLRPFYTDFMRCRRFHICM